MSIKFKLFTPVIMLWITCAACLHLDAQYQLVFLPILGYTNSIIPGDDTVSASPQIGVNP